MDSIEATDCLHVTWSRFQSERESGDRNFAIGYYLKEKKVSISGRYHPWFIAPSNTFGVVLTALTGVVRCFDLTLTFLSLVCSAFQMVQTWLLFWTYTFRCVQRWLSFLSNFQIATWELWTCCKAFWDCICVDFVTEKHYFSKVWVCYIFLFLKVVSDAHQGCIKNRYLWTIIVI